MPRVPHVLLLLALAFGGLAHADGKKDKALALFEKSDKAYKAGKFEDAVKLLQEAYGLYPEPILLYNLGRAQEGMGDVQGAVDSYERYLADAKQIQDRGAIERRVETLKAQLATDEAEKQRLADEEAKRKQAEADRQRAEAERLAAEQRARQDARSPLDKYGPWITIGAGGVLVATGFYFGIRASSTHDDAVAAPVQRDALELQRSAESSATIANVLFVVGGLTTAGGIGWKVWQWRSGSGAAQATVTATPTALAIEGTW